MADPAAGDGILAALFAGLVSAPVAAGALMTTTGLALGALSWPRRSASDVHHLLFAVSFFLVCAGLVGLLAGIGLYH